MATIDRPQIELTAVDNTRAAFDSVKRSFGGLDSVAAGVRARFAGLSAGLAVGAFVLAAKNVANYGEEIAKAAERTGIAAESYSKLQYAARLADVENQALATGLKTLSTNVFENDKAFQALGIQTRDAGGSIRAVDDILGDVAESFSQMKDGAGKSALAVRLFGKAGADMIPFLNQGRDGIRAAGDEAQRFGLVLGSDAAKNMQAFNDNLKRMGAIGQGITVSFFTPAIQGLNLMVENLIKARNEGNLFIGVIKEIAKLNLATFSKLPGPIGAVAGAGADALFQDGNARGGARTGVIRRPGGSATPGLKEAPAISSDDKKGTIQKTQLTFDDLLYKAKLKRLEMEEQAEAQGLEDYRQRVQEEAALDSRAASARAAADDARREANEQRAKQLAEVARAYKDLIDPLNQYVRKLQEIDELEKEGALTAREAIDARFAVNTQMEETNKRLNGLNETTTETNKLFGELGLTITSSLGQLITSGGSARDVVRSLIQDVAQLILKIGVLEPLAKTIRKAFEDMGGGGKKNILSSLLGSAVSFFTGNPVPALASAAGWVSGFDLPMGFAKGTDYVPHDMLAMVHKGEKIIPAAQNKPGVGGVNVVQNITLNVESSGDAGKDAQTILSAIAPAVKAIVRTEITGQLRSGGVLAGA